MNQFSKINSVVAVIDIENIDTDQIIGSDHLKITDKKGLGKHLFADWRYLKDGSDNPDFVLNQALTRAAEILVAGDNFACGSSREHAPWALLDHGFKVVISSSIADIFRNNAIKNGLLAIQVDPNTHQKLLACNGKSISVDLETQTIIAEDFQTSFELEAFARYCLLNGIDQLDFLLQHQSQIDAFEQQREATSVA